MRTALNLVLTAALLAAGLAGVVGCDDNEGIHYRDDRSYRDTRRAPDYHRGDDRPQYGPPRDGPKRVQLIFHNRTDETLRVMLTNEQGHSGGIGRVKPGQTLRHVVERRSGQLPTYVTWEANGARGRIPITARSPEVQQIAIGRDGPVRRDRDGDRGRDRDRDVDRDRDRDRDREGDRDRGHDRRRDRDDDD